VTALTVAVGLAVAAVAGLAVALQRTRKARDAAIAVLAESARRRPTPCGPAAFARLAAVYEMPPAVDCPAAERVDPALPDPPEPQQ
jgi:hypothetical protein